MKALPEIPFIDIREGGALRHAAQNPARARALRDACFAFFPRAAAPLLPAMDGAARRWLTRSCSPYVSEIEEIASSLGFPGVWTLNASYLWGCTALAREEDGAPWLVRTLDWPFRGLGRHADLVHGRGAAGDYFSVTWPGYAGALTAMAPGRFAACVNQAPMRRRSRHTWLRAYDLAANARHTWANIRYIPPDQLLRLTFETCETYDDAKRMLEQTPVARPVIYTLIGCEPGERCVIERTDVGYKTRETDTSAANDWEPNRPQWEARIGGASFLTRSSAEATARCRARRDALAGWPGRLSSADFDWVAPPVLNPCTRLAVAMSPARGTLRVVGYEKTDAEMPERATQVREIAID
ncbi:hypothetical protein [Methylocapsa acidiphila]|uniref:hypothetical protein n=1 Tax=Methylocapsa acidiphila TaxID=133552 RepID=UPI000412BA01|nr:hypothetical protein [Methylocapsa acidiphila]